MFLLKVSIKSYKLKLLKNYIKNEKLINKRFKKIFRLKKSQPSIKDKYFTVLRSPHINKKSKEHFRYRVYESTFFYKINNFIILFNFILYLCKIIKTKQFILKFQIKSY